MSNDTQTPPPLLRPIPRRPFELNLTNPPDSDSEDADSNPFRNYSPLPHQKQQNPNLLTPSQSGFYDGSGGESLSRKQSFVNLTKSALSGIFSPTVSSAKEREDMQADMNLSTGGINTGISTPWGTGAQTPIKRAGVDEVTLGLMRHRAAGRADLGLGRQSSISQDDIHSSAEASEAMVAVSWFLRVGILFLLGMGYGVLVTRLQGGHTFADGYGIPYLVFWGVSGVGLGALLPWFDGFWQQMSGQESDVSTQAAPAPGTDWALVMRGVGAFVGIVFAIVSPNQCLRSRMTKLTSRRENSPGRRPSKYP